MTEAPAAAALPLCVAVMTHNRAELAVRAVESVVAQLRPDDELLVMDDGSTDGTPERVRAWLESRRPSARVLELPPAGLSVARNAALRAAGTEVVCFFDDDQRAGDGWLEALRRAWVELGPRAGAVGGPMLADWQAPRPPWLADYFLDVISVLDHGPERRQLEAETGSFLWGGNFSVRVRAALEIGGFDPDRGLRPSFPFDRGEEEDLQRRLAAAGWTIWYEPAAEIHHLVPAERLTPEYFRTFFRNRGLANAAHGRSRVSALPVLARSAARYAVLRARRDPLAFTARLTWTQAWTVLTARRSRLPRLPR